MRTTNLIAGAVVAALSLGLLFWIIPGNTAPAQSHLDIPPALMPSIAAWVCLAMAALMVAGALRMPPEAAAPRDQEHGDTATGLGLAELGHLAILAAIAAAVPLAMPAIGFEATMAGVVIPTMVLLGVRSPVVLLAVGAGLPVALSQLVWLVFTVDLP